ncbi:MAG: Mur ligase family protein [bacterium]|nr:Mur ligase family protein [bacterium]
MQISIETIRAIWEAEVHNVSDGTSFMRLNVAYIREFETGGVREGNELYFVVYKDNPKEEGWYINAFDRTKNIPKLRQRSNIVFVVDGRVSDGDMYGLKYIRVHDVFLAINQLREYVLSILNPLVVGVTGSVGKTTTAAMIQSILSKRFECGRIYSKRLTPLNLSSWIVNYMDPSHEVLCLEYSMYRPHHISFF